MDIGTISAIATGIIILLALLVAVVAVIVNSIAEGKEIKLNTWAPEPPLFDINDPADPASSFWKDQHAN